MASLFDRIMQRADDTLFRVFGEDRNDCGPTYTAPDGFARPVPLEVILGRNVEVAGADGTFRVVQYLAEIRLSQVRCPKRGGRLTLSEGVFILEEPLGSDALVERWALLPGR
ncbi:hypothetical protein GNE00_15785 [Pseudomonas sp. JL972]|uniref:head-tail joining protein n=1 Tax=Stutzerimonas degradans TaxID=2968968 RepID=UPI0012D95483|nr:hypothetical protein [Stutzerimonas degradans]MTZ15211.1 hypothetical protein [Stutzerimonas degradans]